MHSRGSERTGRRHLAHELNQLLRRLRKYRTEAEWVAALLDGAGLFAGQAAVFALKDGVLTLRGQSNLAIAEGASFAISSAAAFAAAADSRDPVIALRTASEVGEALLQAAEPGGRGYVVPISNGDRVVALLFAAMDGAADGDGLELIAGMASVVLERQANVSLHAQIGRHLGSSS
jgi:hypothetical protein